MAWPGCTSRPAAAAWGSPPRTTSGRRRGCTPPAHPVAGVRNPIGYGMCAPTIATHGTPEQKARYLRPLFDNEEIWCQLFSEPGAGSDVAGLVDPSRA